MNDVKYPKLLGLIFILTLILLTRVMSQGGPPAILGKIDVENMGSSFTFTIDGKADEYSNQTSLDFEFISTDVLHPVAIINATLQMLASNNSLGLVVTLDLVLDQGWFAVSLSNDFGAYEDNNTLHGDTKFYFAASNFFMDTYEGFGVATEGPASDVDSNGTNDGDASASFNTTHSVFEFLLDFDSGDKYDLSYA